MKKQIFSVLGMAMLMLLCSVQGHADIKTNRFNCIFLEGDTTTLDSAALAQKAYVEEQMATVPKDQLYNDAQAMIKVSREFKKENNEDVVIWWFEVPDSVIGRDILAISRVTKAPAGFGAYGGEMLQENMVRFELSPDKKKLFLRRITTDFQCDSTDAISKAVNASGSNPISVSFKIESEKDGVYKINASALINDAGGFGIPSQIKNRLSLFDTSDRASYIESIHSYPTNIELRTIRNLGSGNPIVEMQYNGFLTFGVNISMVMLPKEPMRMRINDPRVGYFNQTVGVFSDAQQKLESKTFVARWRLEPKNEEDAQKQRNGELIEPAKQIVYYIDPATPEQWRPYLIQGVKDWNAAFEKAGWKNAIDSREWPENDSTMSMEDARYSVIRYLASTEANAYGPNVHDPRSGEIIESHVGWYHNVMTLVHDWYQVQCGHLDPEARKPKFSTELMGQLIRFVSSHEIGHTLGLRHNFRASTTVPTDSLRSNDYLTKYGHCPSIMDYARFNYVAQPEDGIEIQNLFPRINDYDKWAIEWGYKPVEASSALDEQFILTNKTTEYLAEHKNLRWEEGEDFPGLSDPRSDVEVLGDDVFKTAEYYIANLKRILPQLDQWQYSNDDVLGKNAANSYDAAMGQLQRIEFAIDAYTSGALYETRLPSEDGPTMYYAPRESVLKVLNYYNKYYISEEPRWFTDVPYLSRYVVIDEDTRLVRMASHTQVLSNPFTLMSINPNITVTEYVNTLMGMVLQDYLTKNATLPPYRQALIQTHMNNLTWAAESSQSLGASADCVAQLMNILRKMQVDFRKAATLQSDAKTRAFYEMIDYKIEQILTIRDKKTNSGGNTIVISLG